MYNFQVKRRAVTFSLAAFFVPLLSALVLSALFLSGVAQAKTTITLDDDYAVAFSSGQLDPNRYDGEMYDVEILKDGSVLATADRVLVESEGKYGTDDFIMKQLEIDNLVIDGLALAALMPEVPKFSGDKLDIEVRKLRARNFLLAALRSNDPVLPDQWTKDNSPTFNIEDIKMTIEELGMDLSIAQISSTPTRYGNFPDGAPYFADGGIELSSFRMTPVGGSEAAAISRANLGALGLKYFEMSMTIKANINHFSTDLAYGFSYDIRMTDLLDLFIHTEFHMPLDTYHALPDAIANFSKESENIAAPTPEQSFAIMNKHFGSLIKTVGLSKVQIASTDRGLLDRITQFDKSIPPRAVFAPAAEAAIFAILPRNGSHLAPPVKKFLAKGGTLQIVAEPKTPFPLLDFVAAGLAPDQIANQLRLSATHKP